VNAGNGRRAKALVILVALVISPPGWGQVVGAIEGGRRTDHLYERVVRSEYVVRGKVVALKGIMVRNIPKPEIQPDGAHRYHLKDLDGGTVIQVEIGEPLCRQADFEIPGAARELPSNPLYLYAPPGRQQSDLFPGMGQAEAKLFPGREYLLFVVRHRRTQGLLEKYRLDEDKTYYRVYEGFWGAQEVNSVDDERERRIGERVLQAVEGLCGAVRVADGAEKLARLRALLERAEPEWRQSVEQAIAGVEAGLRE
jgi:hypothetical protein